MDEEVDQEDAASQLELEYYFSYGGVTAKLFTGKDGENESDSRT